MPFSNHQQNNSGRLVCFCNGVKLSQILEIINNGKALSMADIERLTGASTGCGRCRKKVESVFNENVKIMNADFHQ